jgi:outer membrane protein OmpU
MRKILLATTALAGVAFFAGSAQAGMEVTVGGYNDFRAGFFDNDLTGASNRRHLDFQDEFQLEVEAKAKANNGMEYGVVASLWNGADYNNWAAFVPTTGSTADTGPANNNARIHQAYGYVNGAWGQIRTGDEHGASDFGVYAPTTYDWGGQVNGSYTQFLTPSTVWGVTPSFVDDLENNTKISYFTPKFGVSGHKFQAGVSYTPNWYDAGVGVVVNDPTTGTQGNPLGTNNYKDVIELGAGYEGNWFDKFSTKAGFVFHTADNIDNRTFGGPTVATQGVRDYSSWGLGAQVGYAGFTVGGNYTDAGDYNKTQAQTDEQTSWTVGASYKFDRASIAASYLAAEGYNNMLNGTATAASGAQSNYVSDYSAWGIGAGYSLFDGMVTSVDAVFFEQDASGTVAGNRDVSGHVVILSNRISF